MEKDKVLLWDYKPPNTEIWIADDVVIMCRTKYSSWQKFFVELFLGWKVKEIDGE